MTDTEYGGWLADLSASRIVLCEIESSKGTYYVSSHPYISKPTDQQANQVYDDVMSEAVDIETRADSLISIGELKLVNDGSLDDWSEHVWQGYEVRFYLGAKDWSRDDFRLHVKCLNNGISSFKRGSIVFDIVDLSEKLNAPIDTGQLPNDGGPVPLALGTVYNAPAVRVDSQTLTYKASYLPVLEMSAKDGGNTSSASYDLAAGTFTLEYNTQAQLTVDIREQHNTASKIAQFVADHYGIEVGTVDAPDYEVGLFYSSPPSGRQILDDLCDGLNAYWYLDEVENIVIRQHQKATSADVILVDDDILYDRISLVETQAPLKALTIQYKRNYSVLSTVAGVIEDNDAEEAARLKREYSETTISRSLNRYPTAVSEVRSTCIANKTDAEIERDRMFELKATRFDVFEIEAFMPVVTIGQSITVDHRMTRNRVGRIISVSRSPTKFKTVLRVQMPASIK